MTARNVVIVDTGGANLASVRYALERLQTMPTITQDPVCILQATHILLPGVGAAGYAMERIHRAQLATSLRAARAPILGICLGMQLLFDASEENDTDCLGLLSGTVRKLSAPNLPIPHMGWNRTFPTRKSPLLEGIDAGAFFYFVHSYAVPVGEHAIATTTYGATFTAAVQQGARFGVQFHPERSSAAGSRLLANFLALSFEGAESGVTS